MLVVPHTGNLEIVSEYIRSLQLVVTYFERYEVCFKLYPDLHSSTIHSGLIVGRACCLIVLVRELAR